MIKIKDMYPEEMVKPMQSRINCSRFSRFT
jgi:hypothetical protein